MEITTTNQLKESGLNQTCKKCNKTKLLICFKKINRHAKMLDRVDICKGCIRMEAKHQVKSKSPLKQEIASKLRSVKKGCLQCNQLKSLDKFGRKLMGKSVLDRNYVCTICTKANQKPRFSIYQQQRAEGVLARGRDRASLYLKEHAKCL